MDHSAGGQKRPAAQKEATTRRKEDEVIHCITMCMHASGILKEEVAIILNPSLKG